MSNPKTPIRLRFEVTVLVDVELHLIFLLNDY